MCLALALLGCDKEHVERQGAPPPPVASARPAICANGGGTVTDSISAPFFPRSVAGFCIDPQSEVRTYGEQGKLDMDAVCTTAFDGECAVYSRFGLKRLVSLRYADGQGDATVEVYLSRFADAVGAYGMFTKRVVADSDPAEPTTPKPFAAGAAGAIGTGRAYVWKGAYLAELQYNDEQATPEALAQASARVLPLIGKGIGDALPGPGDRPPAVVVLPVEHRVTNGVQLLPKDALGIEGLGPVGVGYYQDGKARWRDIALVADEAKAKAAWKLVKSRPGALPVLGVGDEAVVVTLTGATPEAPRREYVVARKGSLVAGVGDEELAGKEAALSKDAKTARLRAWLAAAKK